MNKLQYFYIDKSSKKVNLDSLKSFINTCDCQYLIRKEVIHSYQYGEHANYLFIDNNDNPIMISARDCLIKGFRTGGVIAHHQLSIDYIHDGSEQTHSLFVDGRFLWALTTLPNYDEEWDTTNPTSTVISFIEDIKTMGIQTRIMLDEVKRELFTTKRSLTNIENDNERMRHLLRCAIELYIPEPIIKIEGNMFEGCSSVIRIILPKTVKEFITSTFNTYNVPKLKEVILLSDECVSIIPPLYGDSGNGFLSTNAVFLVPPKLLNKYKNSALGWKEIKDQIHPLNDDDYSKYQDKYHTLNI